MSGRTESACFEEAEETKPTHYSSKWVSSVASYKYLETFRKTVEIDLDIELVASSANEYDHRPLAGCVVINPSILRVNISTTSSSFH